MKYTFGHTCVRIIVAGSVISLSVFLGKTLGPIYGSLFALFPAAFSTTFIIVSHTMGTDYTRSMCR